MLVKIARDGVNWIGTRSSLGIHIDECEEGAVALRAWRQASGASASLIMRLFVAQRSSYSDVICLV